MSRYSTARELIDWYATRELRVAKMLSFAIYKHETCRADNFVRRFEYLYPKVMRHVFGQEYNFRDLKRDTLQQQGIPITTNRLVQRGDKAKRYNELNEFVDVVFNIYKSIVNPAFKPEYRDPKRTFTDEQVLQACKRQNNQCGVPSCRAQFSVVCPPVGDHMRPYTQGGPTTQENCAALCVRCNTDKGDRDYWDYVFSKLDEAMRGRIKVAEQLTY